MRCPAWWGTLPLRSRHGAGDREACWPGCLSKAQSPTGTLRSQYVVTEMGIMSVGHTS